MKGQITVDQPIDLEKLYEQAKEKNKNLILQKTNSMDQNLIKESKKYVEIANLVRDRIENTRKLIIAIDGVDGSGKSSLAHYLAWQLHLSVIETDLCRKQGTSRTAPKIPNGSIPPIEPDPELLYRLIQACNKVGNPVIVEGIFVLQSLENTGIKPDFLIMMQKSGWDGSFDFTEYNEKFCDFKPDYELIWRANADPNKQ